jgi:hypothetical protein
MDARVKPAHDEEESILARLIEIRSFPRKRESRTSRAFWVPAFAGTNGLRGSSMDARVKPAHDEEESPRITRIGRLHHFFPSPLAEEGARAALEHFPAKWEPVRHRKCDH